jgi:D-alanyl-D-alanine carboxypeptidase
MLTKAILTALLVFGLSQPGVDNSVVFPENSFQKETEQYTAVPHKQTESLGIEIDAKSAIVVDSVSGRMLFEKDNAAELPMASLTKMMTAVVVLDSGVNPEESAVIDSEVVQVEGADIGLKEGEEMRVSDLLYGVLIASGNDAALALAKKIGGSVEGFVGQMNEKASDLGLSNTHFSNPTGLDQEDHFSNVKDLAILANHAFKNPIFQEIVGIKEHDIQALNSDKTHHLKNTNKLLLNDYSNILGGKTGFTDEAGFCLTSFAENERGNQIVVVVLGSEEDGNQFQDTKALVEWTFMNYEWQ